MGLLYEAECKGIEPIQLLAQLPTEPELFVRSILIGVQDHATELDTLLASRSLGWDLGRMAALDRAVLRMATFELAYRPDIPPAVAIAEAVSLASRFSTEESSKFVNGVLSAMARALEDQAGALEDQAGALEDQAGELEDQAGELEDQAGELEDQAGALEDRAGALEDQAGELEDQDYRADIGAGEDRS